MIQSIQNQSFKNVAKMLQKCCKSVANRPNVAETRSTKIVSATFCPKSPMLRYFCNNIKALIYKELNPIFTPIFWNVAMLQPKHIYPFTNTKF